MSSIQQLTPALSGFSSTKYSQLPNPTSPSAITDVIIIGAGISGLRAAQKLQELGYTYALVEANPRVGGRVLSKGVGDKAGVVDLGAAWINDTTQSHIYELVQKYGLHTETQYTKGVESWTYRNGRHATCNYGEFPVSPIHRNSISQLILLRTGARRRQSKRSAGFHHEGQRFGCKTES